MFNSGMSVKDYDAYFHRRKLELEEIDIIGGVIPNILDEANDAKLTDFYLIQNKLLNDIGNEKNYIFNYLINQQFEAQVICALDSFGHNFQVSVCLPKHLLKPVNFSYAMYPLNENCTMFAFPRPYSYLATFSIESFMRADVSDVRWRSINSLLEDQCQSRFSNIWRLMLGVLYACDCDNDLMAAVVRHYLTLLIGRYGKLPFYERRGRFVFVCTDMASVVPTLVYMLMSVAMEVLCGNICVGDAIFIIDHYIILSDGGYFDNKLKIKSAARNWVTEALHNLGSAYVVDWGSDCTPYGILKKDTRECKFIVDGFTESRDERKLKLSSVLYDFIELRLPSLRTLNDVVVLLRICHAATNDRTYYKTLVELSLEKAVKPNVYEKLVVAPVPLMKTTDGVIVNFSFKGRNNFLYLTECILHDISNHIVSALGSIDPDIEWIKFLTTSSAGNKLMPDQLVKYHDVIRKMHNIRVVRAAIDARDYRNMSLLNSGIMDKTSLVVRQQNDRRQRAIAGLTNPKLFASFPSYLLGKLYYLYVLDVAQGKQVGNVMDTSLMLKATSNVVGLCSSVDISGMDTSIQPGVRRLFDYFTYQLAMGLKSSSYGPWRAKRLNIYQVTYDTEGNPFNDDAYKQIEFSGLFQALLSQTATMQSSTTFNSRMFGNVLSKEGTFESGRADTSTHHTVLLSSVLSASRVNYRNDGFCDRRRYARVMGDDMFIHYSGSDQKIEKSGYI